jgi:hypothetical protein
MNSWLIGTALALFTIAAPVSGQEPSAPQGEKVMLWRDIYVGEPKADINSRYPEFKLDAKGKQKRFTFHRADETFIKEKVVLRRDDKGEPICETRQVEVKYDAAGRANKVMLGFFQDCPFATLADTMVAKYGTDAQTIDGLSWYKDYQSQLLGNGLTIAPSSAIWLTDDLRITMSSPDILSMMYVVYEPKTFDTIETDAF